MIANLLSTLPNSDSLELNQIQVIGTHNSYHIQPSAGIDALLAATGATEVAQSWDYTHPSLNIQLENQGMRQFELDVFADPEGGLYANPLGYQVALANNLPVGPDPNPNGVLDQPGLKVLHVQDLDFRTTASTFMSALEELDAWSDANPDHLPILVLVEAKDAPIPSTPELTFTTPIPFDAANLEAIDAEIRTVFTEAEIFTPDDLRADFATLNEAVLDGGWPTLAETQGQILFALDNTSEVRDRYINDHPSLEGRVMFVSAPVGSPESAFLKRNDPFDPAIPELVEQGYLIRTRADANTVEARLNDTSRRDAAFASGAQFVSTDYPEPDLSFSSYQVIFPDGSTVRINPVNGPKLLTLSEGSEENDVLVGDDGGDRLVAFAGNDTLAGGLGNDSIAGGDGDDVLRGDLNNRSPQGDIPGGDDTILGGAGSDRIGGKSGNDQLFGEADDDIIFGDDGDDLLRGGTGNDTLTGDDFSGGTGADTFVLAVGEGTDTITDYGNGGDLIQVLGTTDFSAVQDGNNALVVSGEEKLAILDDVTAADVVFA